MVLDPGVYTGVMLPSFSFPVLTEAPPAVVNVEPIVPTFGFAQTTPAFPAAAVFLAKIAFRADSAVAARCAA